MSSNTNETMSINEILEDFTKRAKRGGGIEGIAVINTSKANIEYANPEKSKLSPKLKSKLITTAKCISMLDEFNNSQTIDNEDPNEKLQVISKDNITISFILSTKTESNYALCVITNINVSTDFITNIFESVHQKNIENVINAMYSSTIN